MRTLQTSEADAVELRRREEARWAAAARRRADELAFYGGQETSEGRPHRDVQTELYLEELTDHVDEMDEACQTDAFLDRPPTPLFVRAKTGLDAETQVYGGDVRMDTGHYTVVACRSLSLSLSLSVCVCIIILIGPIRVSACVCHTPRYCIKTRSNNA